ncbi:MAG: hypothetical protein M1827_001229 [Pycnora praestabilis]|nr:MAG: hypothetical protein M1827_001229 [Pycnora praestabilis]
MREFGQVKSTSLSLPAESYIYSLLPASRNIALISSDDSLHVLDQESLEALPGCNFLNVHNGVTCLKVCDDGGNVLVTAGRDGLVTYWDLRAGKRVSEYHTEKKEPILALDCNYTKNAVIAGTELTQSQAAVVLWDTRLPTKPQLRYVESHNDDITELQFHPSQSSLLLSGSTDGLVNIYDTTISDEDDALHQIINHGSSIHYSGFLSSTDIFALSHDETLSMYQLANSNENVEEPSPIVFGDLRGKLGCEYVVGVLECNEGAIVGIGSHSEQSVVLVPLRSTPQWRFDKSAALRLAGAHGEEIVRSIYINENTSTVYTSGEDGHVRVWRSLDVVEGPLGVSSDMSISKSKKESKTKEGRYKPY